MKELVVAARNFIFKLFYKLALKPVFFALDPEKIHDRATTFGQFLGKYTLTRTLAGWLFKYSHPSLKQSILDITFENPVGLAAGFDKNALLTDILPSVGFGFVEVGSITGEPCPGNPGPRLWRLKKSKALAVHYGLKNDGCEKISQRLKSKKLEIPIGTSIAKTNSRETAETEAGIKDYVKAYRRFATIGDYSTINISCPNAFGGEPFSDPVKLDKLLTEIDKITTSKPVFIKMPVDVSEKEIDQILEVVKKHKIQGFICANLTKKRDNPKIKDKNIPGKGGLSGKIVEELSNRQIAYLYRKTAGKCIIMGVGGVFSAKDAYKKIKLGASLIQMITGMIFEGPQVISEINSGLVKLIKRDGFKNISEAVGYDIK